MVFIQKWVLGLHEEDERTCAEREGKAERGKATQDNGGTRSSHPPPHNASQQYNMDLQGDLQNREKLNKNRLLNQLMMNS